MPVSSLTEPPIGLSLGDLLCDPVLTGLAL
jgi:hypothetical protein